MLINLVKNAKKFTNHGKILIRACYDESNQRLIVHVKDTGVGIDPMDMDKLFSRFGKLERTASQNSEGIGLGLTIVQSIVHKAGGTVLAYSEGIGSGTTFSFYMQLFRA